MNGLLPHPERTHTMSLVQLCNSSQTGLCIHGFAVLTVLNLDWDAYVGLKFETPWVNSLYCLFLELYSCVFHKGFLVSITEYLKPSFIMRGTSFWTAPSEKSPFATAIHIVTLQVVMEHWGPRLPHVTWLTLCILSWLYTRLDSLHRWMDGMRCAKLHTIVLIAMI